MQGERAQGLRARRVVAAEGCPIPGSPGPRVQCMNAHTFEKHRAGHFSQFLQVVLLGRHRSLGGRGPAAEGRGQEPAQGPPGGPAGGVSETF